MTNTMFSPLRRSTSWVFGLGLLLNWPALPTGNNPATVGSAPDSLADLPLTFTCPDSSVSSHALAVFISGDGGWKEFDQKICNGLAARGIPVAGLNALKYFMKARTPEGASWDLNRILNVCEQKWGKTEVILVGYSWGAEVMPFLFNRLNDACKKQVRDVILLSPGDQTAFEYHLSFLINRNGSDARAVKPELEKMYGCHTLFIYGSDEDPAWVKPLIKDHFSLKVLGGGHHYDGNTDLVNVTIRSFLN